MKRAPFPTLVALAALLLSVSACHPDQPATQQPATASPVAASPRAPTKPGVASAPAAAGDTLHLPDGQVVQLRPITQAAFNRLPNNSLYEMPNDPGAEHLPVAGTGVRRQGLALLLQPTQGSAVRLVSTATEAELQNGGVNYMYWGSLPEAHQWAVRAWAWESDGTVLVDQRTGHRLAELPGDPVAAPDGRRVLFFSPGLGGGDQANMLSLAQIEPTGARLLWQIEPTTWEPAEARWAAPNRVVLKRRHALPDGSLTDDARVTYDELIFPR